MNGEVLKEPGFKSRDGLPLFLNAETAVKVPGISPSSGYEPMFTVAKSTPHMRGIRLPVEKTVLFHGASLWLPGAADWKQDGGSSSLSSGRARVQKGTPSGKGCPSKGNRRSFLPRGFPALENNPNCDTDGPPLALGGSFCVKGVHSPELLYFVYFSPHAHMAAKMSFKSLALSVAVYST